MSQRESGYTRIAFDQYETPEWATLALVPHIPARVKRIWEPAAGSFKMVNALVDASEGFSVRGTDIQDGHNFFDESSSSYDAIITNPPYALAQEFIQHALRLTQPKQGFVAMLLRCDYDHAKSRAKLFAWHKGFAKKLVLTKRIRWIEGSKGSPSFNHAWFIWDWQHSGQPEIAYDFQEA